MLRGRWFFCIQGWYMEQPTWYKLSIEEVLHELSTSKEWLDAGERAQRLHVHGRNVLPTGKRLPGWVRFLMQFKDLMIILLLVTATIAFFLNDLRTAVIILLIVVVNATIWYIQEAKAEKIVLSLKRMVNSSAQIVSWWEVQQVPSESLVPWDIVEIQEWDSIPADLRLIREDGLQTNDFSLTGESNPQNKHTHAIPNDVLLWDRSNIVFMWTTVAVWRGRGVVIQTWFQTELGKIAWLSNTISQTLSPLQREFNHTAKYLTYGTLIVWTCMFLIARWNSLSWHEALLFAVGIAAAMVPQWLPAQISIALSSAASRLSRKNALVKKLSAVETLWAVNVICTDKTWTLTANEMTVTQCRIGQREYAISGVWYEPKGDITHQVSSKIVSNEDMSDLEKLFLEVWVFASTAYIHEPDEHHATWYCIGDPTEAALITLAGKAWIDKESYPSYTTHKLFAFDSDRKRMSSVVVLPDGRYRIYVKWAIQSLLPLCSHILDGETLVEATNDVTTELTKQDDALASQAKRILGYAYKEVDQLPEHLTMERAESELTFLGFVSMIDPPRADVADAVRVCYGASIKMIVITWDYALTANAIGQLIGLDDEWRKMKTIPWKDLRKMQDFKVVRYLQQYDSIIFSRMSPEDKIRIVSLCKQQWWLVAVTGDGINDAPSLKKADIGVAMWKTWTAVAKDAAEIILLDDSFATLTDAIEEGRVIYGNLQKTVLSSMTSNGGELFVVLMGIWWNVLFGWPFAISAIQILAIDLIGEMLPLAALTYDPPESDNMKKPPRNVDDHMLSRAKIWDLIFSWLLMGWLAYAVFCVGHLLYDGNMPTWVWYAWTATLTYLTIVFCQFANILSRRSLQPLMHLWWYVRTNRKLRWSFALSLWLICILFYVPFIAGIFSFSPLTRAQRWLCLLAWVVFFLVKEGVKVVRR